jgi:hypothetical protein
LLGMLGMLASSGRPEKYSLALLLSYLQAGNVGRAVYRPVSHNFGAFEVLIQDLDCVSIS